ncbi:hypothetical protein [Butyricimonas synergistica]|uniref:hypothetical protein n=1 Tax=Butyricimonas synergistica TaxID=544644 RepID=UPI00047599F8|nr:hypothetical protein [Butyricimonas synergistica]
MPDFINSEYSVEKLFPAGTAFSFEGKKYHVVLCGKPRPSQGECKTDVYIKGVTSDKKDTVELKISVKQQNADFLENKMSLDRACEIFGKDASDIIKRCLLSIQDCFVADYLVYFKGCGKTEAHTMKLGWKFELLNKLSGEKSGVLELTEEQKYDVFAGINLSEDKKNSRVNGQIINDSGVANYILNIDNDNMTQDTCLRNLQPIEEYAKSQTIYFACKALNYRFDKSKWDGPRPLSVYVDWFIDNGKLNARLIFDYPLEHNGNEVGEKLKSILKELKIKKFDDLRGVLSHNVRCYSKE